MDSSSTYLDNLEELQAKVTQRIGLLLACIGGFLAWLTMPQGLPPIRCSPVFLLASECFLFGILILMLQSRHPRLARYVLVLTLALAPLQTMLLTDDIWVPFAGSLVVFPSAMVILYSDFITAGLIALLTVGLTTLGFRDYPVIPLLGTLGVGVILARLTLYNLYTALQWTWVMQEHASQLLAETRNNRAALKRTVRSLEVAYEVQERAKHELMATKQYAEEARRMKERFAANISHELRTPLNVILGFSEIMHLSPDVYGDLRWPPKLRRDIQEIYNSSRHLLQMIDDILDLSRFQMSEFSLNVEPTPLVPLLRETLKIMEPLFQGDAVRLEADFGEDLPILEIDRTRIRQVLINLLNNARRFTETGTVLVRARQYHDEVTISVIDEGCGIPADKLQNIFTEFYQVDSTLHRKQGGTGLGLTISKHFVEAHRGRITVESIEGQGSTFSFTLPVSQAVHVQYHPRQRTAAPGKTGAGPSPLPCVLVVENDPALISILRRQMEDYSIISVANPDLLEQAVQANQPVMVIWNNPPAQLSNRIATLEIPVVACTLPSNRGAAEKLGVMACFEKPIDSHMLLDAIDHLSTVERILVIDDERWFVQFVERLLEANGHDFRISRAYSGQQGLEVMRQQQPDLVLLDLAMPEVDGLQVLKAMKADPRLAGIPVFLLTATNFVQDSATHPISQVTMYHRHDPYRSLAYGILKAIAEVLSNHGHHRSGFQDSRLPEEATVIL